MIDRSRTRAGVENKGNSFARCSRTDFAILLGRFGSRGKGLAVFVD